MSFRSAPDAPRRGEITGSGPGALGGVLALAFLAFGPRTWVLRDQAGERMRRANATPGTMIVGYRGAWPATETIGPYAIRLLRSLGFAPPPRLDGKGQSALSGRCNVCGLRTRFLYSDPALHRESLNCVHCLTTSRYRSMARGLLEAFRRLEGVRAMHVEEHDSVGVHRGEHEVDEIFRRQTLPIAAVDVP